MLKGCSISVMMFWAVLFALFIFSFDHAMRVDSDHLCDNGSSGYGGC